MDIIQVVKERRSIRKFKPDQVSESLIRDILDEARWSPSWGNTQPWEFYVVTGEALKKFKIANCSKLDEGVPPSPDIKMPESWTEPLKKRYRAIGKSTLDALGLAREDTKGRTEQTRIMFRLFDAPCLIIACVDKRSSSLEYAMFDVGLFTQTLCLLAHDRGLGTCIMACAVCFPSALKDVLPDAENKLMAAGIALGYPDREAPINNFDRERAPLEESIIWVK
jgi:nitroreductase